MTLMQRRRALMAKKESNILFEWDYTEGLNSKINSVAAVSPTMGADGLLVSGGSDAFSACAIAPNIDPITVSYRATIDYISLSSDGSDCAVGFWHYNNSAKRVRIYKQKINAKDSIKFVNASNTITIIGLALANQGTVIIEYNAVANKIKYTQGANSFEATIDTPSEPTFQARIINAQKGSSVNASVKIRHIKIERV